MDYIEGLNLSIAYIEDNLFEDIDYEEEHIFTEKWFQNGGVPNGICMWVPIIKK